jgi:hypothetical protein
MSKTAKRGAERTVVEEDDIYAKTCMYIYMEEEEWKRSGRRMEEEWKKNGRRVEEERWKVEVGEEERKRKREEEEEVGIYPKWKSDATEERNKVAQYSSEAEGQRQNENG